MNTQPGGLDFALLLPFCDCKQVLPLTKAPFPCQGNEELAFGLRHSEAQESREAGDKRKSL